jgi:TIR domain
MGKVFISYAHERPEQDDRVLALANALRANGVDAEIDRYEDAPPYGWAQWCAEQLRPDVSDHVLMICNETYLKRVENRVPADEGRGVFWEGAIINGYLYTEKENLRFLPILFDDTPLHTIPAAIRTHTSFRIRDFALADEGYADLYRKLTNQPETLRPPLGPREARTNFPLIAPSRLFRGSNTGSDVFVGRDDELQALDAAWDEATKKNVVTIVAWGGVGKTSLVSHWAARKLAEGGVDRYFDWSFFTAGGADKTASPDLFLKSALEFFGDTALANSSTSAWDKGAALARLVAEQKALLILDGLEPLQDAKSGAIREESLVALLRGLAGANLGLCLVTTRQEVPDLRQFRDTTAPEWRLSRISTAASVELLKQVGVKGEPKELEQLATDLKGHALTLSMLGRFLAEAYGGDVRKRDLVDLSEADDSETSGHAFQVMDAYNQWLTDDGREAELAILRLLGLFDRPATPDCLAALRHEPAIEGLTDTLVDLGEAKWNIAARRLVKLGLVEEQEWESRQVTGYDEATADRCREEGARGWHFGIGAPQPFRTAFDTGVALDAHPLVREYFAAQGRARGEESWRAAHERLFDHLIASVPYWPEGLDGLQPLYQAVAHGCHGARYKDALTVYQQRILRGDDSPQARYSARRLGASSANLAAVASFFIEPWTKPFQAFNADDRAWLVNDAGFGLRALSRLREARRPSQMAMEMVRQGGSAENTRAAATNHGELQLLLGDIQGTIDTAAANIGADGRATSRSVVLRTLHAIALDHAGREDEAFEEFERAKAEQMEAMSHAPALYSTAGFRWCDFMLHHVEQVAWRVTLGLDVAGTWMAARVEGVEMHAAHTLALGKQHRLGFLSIGLDLLSLARTALYLFTIHPEDYPEVREMAGHRITAAVQNLRDANNQGWLARCLLTRAWVAMAQEDPALCRATLDEVQEVAERAPMPLLLADTHLYRARLFFREDRAAAQRNLKAARKLIEKHGYLRRREELDAAEAVL